MADLKQAGVLPPPASARKPVGGQNARADEPEQLTVLLETDQYDE